MSSIIVSSLNIYPIKSCAGIPVSIAVIDRRGFRNDRRWMIVDSTGKFLTQRVLPRLSLVKTSIEPYSLTVTGPSMAPLDLPVELSGSPTTEVEVWGDRVQALQAGPEARAWFSQFLGIDCQPVFMPESSSRVVDPQNSSQERPISFADGFPFLLISEASLEDLNSRLPEPILMNRFRPNIVVRGCDPYAEDSWKSIRIGGVRFQVAKPCARCVTTTVDQAKGTAGKEPLHTLSLYRNRNGKVLFGQNLTHEGTGMLRVGDQVAL